MSSEIVLQLAEFISENLAFRDSIDNLFSYIASLEKTNIIIDFLGIKSITGSFAHQYIINKKKKGIGESIISSYTLLTSSSRLHGKFYLLLGCLFLVVDHISGYYIVAGCRYQVVPGEFCGFSYLHDLLFTC